MTIDRLGIERASRALIERIWRNRLVLFPMGVNDRLEMLNPRIACAELGLKYDPHPELPWYTPQGIVKVAGVLDRDNDTVSVAERLGPTVERFTAAHEIGHVLLHPGAIMHRELPDWQYRGQQKPLQEREADYFAACFLVPINLLAEEFEGRFGAPGTLVFDETSGFWLSPGEPERLAEFTREQRANALATVTRFNGRSFQSLCQRFCVSRTAMKIRLIETGLVSGWP